MKFIVEFDLEKEKIPIDYRSCFLSVFKTCLSKANNGRYYNDYYTPSKEKPYTWSVVFEKPKFLKDAVYIDGRHIKLMISTSDTKSGFILFSAFSAYCRKKFPLPMDNSMRMTRIAQLKEQNVSSNRILIKMLEPLCIRKHDEETNKDWYYSSKQKEFEEEFKRVIKEQLIAAGFSESISNVNIIPINARTVIIKFYGINVESSLGDFILEGDKAVLNYLLKSGMGSRKSAGFGCFKLIAEE